MKSYTVITLFPELIETYKKLSIIGRAGEDGLFEVNAVNPREYSEKRRHVDDTPYGGGPGMVIMIEPVKRAIDDIKGSLEGSNYVINLTPQGKVFRQNDVSELLAFDNLVLIAGRYEGIDERIRHYVDAEYSAGDFVLSGGEIPAILMIDAIVRNIPGVLGDSSSLETESHSEGLLDFPHYTKPRVFDGFSVPQVLLSGNHRQIEKWRQKQRLGRTSVKRPDMIDDVNLDDKERALLGEFLVEQDRLFDE